MQREAGTSSSATNGVAAPPAAATAATNKDPSTNVSASSAITTKEGDVEVNGAGVEAREARVKTTSNNVHPPAPASPVASTSEGGRAVEPSADPIITTTRALSINAQDAKVSAPPIQNGLSDVSKAKVQLKTSKIPTGTKLSWAQIAR